MKNLGILNSKLFFFIMAPLRKVKEDIYSFIYFTLTVVILKMVI